MAILGTSGAVMHLPQYFCIQSRGALVFFPRKKMFGHVTCVEIISEHNTAVLTYLSHVRFAVLRDVFYKIAFSRGVTLFMIYVKI